MAWAVHREWGKAVQKVRRELSEVVQTIARYEPVRLLTPHGAAREARREFSSCSNVTVVEAPVDDIWMRDIAPTFAWRGNGDERELVAIDWNFNGWGGTKDRPARRETGLPTRHRRSLASRDCGSIRRRRRRAGHRRPGHAGHDANCLLNPNRNPVRRGEDRQRTIETELANLGVRRLIWLEGDPCEPLTSGHIDGYVLCAPSGVVWWKPMTTRPSNRRCGASTTSLCLKMPRARMVARSRSRGSRATTAILDKRH